jgi:hypothetical protein
MQREITERDWKLLRELKPIALERFCDRVLAELAGVAGARDKGSHDRYLTAFDLIHRRNEELANAFDGLRRSTALFQFAAMRSLGLVTDEELARFSAETREAVRLILGG